MGDAIKEGVDIYNEDDNFDSYLPDTIYPYYYYRGECIV